MKMQRHSWYVRAWYGNLESRLVIDMDFQIACDINCRIITSLDFLVLAKSRLEPLMCRCSVSQPLMLSHSTVLDGRKTSGLCSKTKTFRDRTEMLSNSLSSWDRNGTELFIYLYRRLTSILWKNNIAKWFPAVQIGIIGGQNSAYIKSSPLQVQVTIPRYAITTFR